MCCSRIYDLRPRHPSNCMICDKVQSNRAFFSSRFDDERKLGTKQEMWRKILRTHVGEYKTFFPVVMYNKNCHDRLWILTFFFYLFRSRSCTKSLYFDSTFFNKVQERIRYAISSCKAISVVPTHTFKYSLGLKIVVKS